MSSGALHVAAPAGLAVEPAVAGHDPAPGQHQLRPAPDHLALVGRVVGAHVQGGGVERLRPLGVPHHHVGVAARTEAALAGKQAERAGGGLGAEPDPVGDG